MVDEKTIATKMKDGWIKSSMFIEVLATNEEFARSALEKHVEKMSREDQVIIYKKDYGEVKKSDKPPRGVQEAYSAIVQLEMVTESYEKLVYLAMNYGPTSIEILEPEKVVLDGWQAQGIVNSVADMMHKFAAIGVGGVVINT